MLLEVDSFFYIIVSLFFTNLILAVIFFTAYFSMGKERHILIWAATFIIGALQWLTNIFKPDNFIVYWMLVCSFSVGTIVFGTWGHLVRTGYNFGLKVLFSSGIIVLLVTYYFTAVHSHRGLSMSVYIFHTVFLLCFCSIIILKHRERPRAAEVGAAASYFLFAIAQGIAATFALMQGAEIDPYFYSTYKTINFLSLPTGFVGMSLFIVFVLASDMSEKMREQAITDSLTGCLNRRGFYDNADNKLAEFIRKRQHVCLIYWDIDKFKNINDTYGHLAGDEVLSKTTAIIKNNIKEKDLLGRIGGEEFVIILGRASAAEAKGVAERLRMLIEANLVEIADETIKVTASFGVVELFNIDTAVDKAIDIADKALYEAKGRGRNRVVEATL